jgi:hypothetical protein
MLQRGRGPVRGCRHQAEVAAVTRTCVYDRANLGRSDPAPGPRGLTDLVGDVEDLLEGHGLGTDALPML